MSVCYSKPGAARYSVRWTRTGWVVIDPAGRIARDGGNSMAEAEQAAARLQRAADCKVKVGPRACLCCGQTFESAGLHNRLCTSCRSRGDGGLPNSFSFAGATGRRLA